MTAPGRMLIFAVGLLAAAASATAQQPEKVYRVGFIGLRLTPPPNPPLDAFRNALRDRGWVEGRNLVLEFRYTDGKTERVPGFAEEFIRSQTDVIVTVSDPVTAAVARVTRTLPIVMATGGDPVKIGVAESLARPGKNVTGFINYVGPEVFGKYLELLKEMRPQTKRLAILWDVDLRAEHLAEMPRAAQALGMETRVWHTPNRAALEAALAGLTTDRPDAVFVLGGPVNFAERQLIVDWTLKHRMPAMSDVNLFARDGLLMGYSGDFVHQLRRVGEVVDKILRSAKPAELPIELPSKFQLIVNRKTATVLGLTIPSSVLARADNVID